jgi:protein TonB
VLQPTWSSLPLTENLGSRPLVIRTLAYPRQTFRAALKAKDLGNLAAGHRRSYDSNMSYKALLFCPEEKTALVVTQVLTELDFQPERCNEVFTAVKKLTSTHFDAVVVDCDNEQNAGLLFKSALHSGSNQQSLAVAVVEDQNGVAAAFRLGANLVLTKPISLEQSRSTLRVARGLLRKTEGSRPTAVPTTSNAPFDPTSLADMVAAKPISGAPTTPAFSASAAPAASIFEVEKEPELAPDASEAALLESMPDPLVGKTFAREPAAEKASPWPTAPKPAEPGTNAWPRNTSTKPETASPGLIPTAQAVAEKPSNKPTVSAARTSPSAGAAAAPARAKEPVRVEEPVRTEIEPPTFSSFYGSEPREGFGGGGSKKLLWIAAGMLVVAIGGYAGWTKLHSVPSGPKAPALTVPPQIAAPAQPIASPAEPEATSDISKSPAPAETASAVPVPDITLSTEEPPAPKTKLTRTPAASVPARTKPAPAAEPRDVLVVTNTTSKPAPPPPVAEPDAPPPSALEIASNSGDQAISGIMASSSASAVQPAHSIQLSQGVAQGLLIKQVRPTYPDAAHRLRLQGAVELLANISKDGDITNLKQLSGDRILGHSAMEAVKQWKYKPYLLDGQPVEIQTQITVNFKLP